MNALAHKLRIALLLAPLSGLLLSAESLAQDQTDLEIPPALISSQDVSAPLNVALPFNLGHVWMSVGVDYLDPDESSMMDGATFNGLTESNPGLDMNVALDAGFLGELAVGFRVRQSSNATIVDVIPNEDFNPITSLGLGWSRGEFSGQLDAHQYPLESGESQGAMIDIDFAWRTPWQGTVSLGARNILDAREMDGSTIDSTGFDQMYGRMPYVRYQPRPVAGPGEPPEAL